MQFFMLVGDTGVQLEEESGKTVKVHITSVTPNLQDFDDFSQYH